MKRTIIMIGLTLISWGAFAQHDHGGHGDKKEMQEEMGPMFKNQQLGMAYDKYVDLKNALVLSNSIEAQNASAQLFLALQELKNGDEALAAAKTMTEKTTLEHQRKAFVDLSNQIVVLVKRSKLMMGNVFIDFCPMANDNNGAYWLSSEMAIANPYFGDKMLKCGSVTEKL